MSHPELPYYQNINNNLNSLNNDNEKYDNDNNSFSIIIEELTSITPEYFTELWNNLSASITFNSFLNNENTTIENKLNEIIQHFTNNLFYIVAAGQIETIVTIYGFISGTQVFGNETINFYFLFEFKLDFNDVWKFDCICKCTDGNLIGSVIQRMHLGDIFQQVNNNNSS